MNSTQNIISKMNKIRLLYIEANNKINEQLDKIVSLFVAENKNLEPFISTSIKIKIQEQIKAMREMAVNGIDNTFEQGFYKIPNPDGNYHSFSSSRRFPRYIIEYLEKSFSQNNYPTDFEKARLAKCCNLSTKQVNNWFTNKRNRNKMYLNCNK